MAILDKTMESAEISAETATECNLDLGAGLNSFWLLKIQITPDDAGYSTYTLYRDDTYAGDVAYEVDTNNLVPFYDPVHLDGESLSNEGPGVICQYVDEDASHEFHLKIHNQALIARTYSVKIWYTEDFSDTLKTKLDGIATSADVTGSNAPQAHKDSHDPNDGSDALDCAAPAELASVQAAAEGTAHTLARSDHAHQIQHSIADNHIVTIDQADAASGEFTRLTANGLESRSDAEVKNQLGYLTDVSDDTTPTLGGDLDASNKTIDNCETVQFNSEYDNGSKDDDFTITLDTAQKQKVTLTANTMTITLANPTSVGHWQVKIVNGGLATITWATSSGAMHWIGEVEPTLASDGYNLLMLYCDGTNIIGQATPDIGVAA